MGAPELSSLLWKERELLDLLTFKLETEQLLLTSGKTRWIQHTSREVEQVLERLRIIGLARTVEVVVLAQEWHVGEDVSLRELAACAPEGPWGEIFAAHLSAMTEYAGHIGELRESNEQFLRASARSTQETVAGIGRGPGTYDSHGKTGNAAARPRLFDAKL